MTVQPNDPFLIGLIDLTPKGRTPRASALGIMLRRLRRPKSQARPVDAATLAPAPDRPSVEPSGTSPDGPLARRNTLVMLWRRLRNAVKFEWKGVDNGAASTRPRHLPPDNSPSPTGTPQRPEHRPPTTRLNDPHEPDDRRSR